MTSDDEFDVVYADPPWRCDNRTPGREVENHYPTMALDDIKELQVPAAADSVLYLWATVPLLPAALDVMSAWGFDYRSNAVWDKEIPGMGYWFRGQHEHLLVGVRGKWSPPSPALRVASVHREPRQRHSKKPEHVRRLIASWWPDARRLEMFCRYPSPGWSVWGNQVDSSRALETPDRFDPRAARFPGQAELFGGAA
jgi:N6-adenosine-specific RNA methylase IME4